jgi:hypothetical protein
MLNLLMILSDRLNHYLLYQCFTLNSTFRILCVELKKEIDPYHEFTKDPYLSVHLCYDTLILTFFSTILYMTVIFNTESLISQPIIVKI